MVEIGEQCRNCQAAGDDVKHGSSTRLASAMSRFNATRAMAASSVSLMHKGAGDAAQADVAQGSSEGETE
jgi:hypothetical protein